MGEPATRPPFAAISSVSNADLRCGRCDYDGRGLPAGLCPECGFPFDPRLPPAARIPWVRRHQIGIAQGYLTTVFLIVLRPRRFAEQARRWVGVNSRDGELFRRLTVLITALSVAVVCSVPAAIGDQNPGPHRLFYFVRDGAIAFLTAGVFFLMATLRVPVDFPKASKDFTKRFAALQKYCCAGLSLSVIVAATAVAFSIVDRWGNAPTIQSLAGAAFWTSIIMTFVAWCGGCAMYLMFAGSVDAKIVVSAALKSALLWMVAGAVAGATNLISFGLFELIRP